jgi:hypothetical protein
MSAYGKISNRAAWCRLVLGVCCCLTPGCSLLHGPAGRPEPDAPAEVSSEPGRDWADAFRRPGIKGGQMGLDPRAREIESRLDVR